MRLMRLRGGARNIPLPSGITALVVEDIAKRVHIPDQIPVKIRHSQQVPGSPQIPTGSEDCDCQVCEDVTRIGGHYIQVLTQ